MDDAAIASDAAPLRLTSAGNRVFVVLHTAWDWLLDSSDFVPRRLCGAWTSGLVLVHNASDAIIWLAYLMIPLLLVRFARRRRDLPFSWMFVLFGAFIVGCGFTHFIEVVIFYRPIYRISAVVKLMTAAVSMATVAALVPVLPRALALRSPAELEEEVEERKKVEARLRLAARELERSNRELQEFAAVASHDLKEPLRKIRAFGDRLQARYGPLLGEDGRDYLGRMVGASDRMSRLIEDLLALSRLSRPAEAAEPVALAPLAREVLGDLEARVAETGARVEIGDLPTVLADPSQMRQLFQNLLGNALKFRKPGIAPSLAISARREPDGAVTLRFVDDGIGFEPADTERIFQVFQRLHGRSEYEGTGIGLAICRRIVERHGGAITAEGEPGRGAAFLVTLPGSALVREPGR